MLLSFSGLEGLNEGQNELNTSFWELLFDIERI
ncbi:MAG: hypothetical protein JWN42_1961 [Candidatus Angelobacter sp.]|nr:hypothetical protein [Candidatus Angelobacter sp.]